MISLSAHLHVSDLVVDPGHDDTYVKVSDSMHEPSVFLHGTPDELRTFAAKILEAVTEREGNCMDQELVNVRDRIELALRVALSGTDLSVGGWDEDKQWLMIYDEPSQHEYSVTVGFA